MGNFSAGGGSGLLVFPEAFLCPALLPQTSGACLGPPCSPQVMKLQREHSATVLTLMPVLSTKPSKDSCAGLGLGGTGGQQRPGLCALGHRGLLSCLS